MRDTLDAKRDVGDLDRGALAARRRATSRSDEIGGAGGDVRVVRRAEAGDELRQIVRAVAPPLRVKERDERLVHLAGVLEALRRILRHRRGHDGHQLGRDVRAQQLDRRVLARLHAAERLERRRRAERVHPRHALVQDDPEGEEIAPRVDHLAARLFGAHVPELALELSRVRVGERAVLDRAARLGDSEVGDLHLPFEAQEDVLRAHVAVDDVERAKLLVAPAVGVVEPLGHLGGDEDAHVDG